MKLCVAFERRHLEVIKGSVLPVASFLLCLYLQQLIFKLKFEAAPWRLAFSIDVVVIQNLHESSKTSEESGGGFAFNEVKLSDEAR